MSAINTISTEKLLRLIGTHTCPAIIDVRSDSTFARDEQLLPASVRKDSRSVTGWGAGFAGHSVIVVCEDGARSSPGVAAWLRRSGAGADVLEGGFAGWKAMKLPLVEQSVLPPRDGEGRTHWVTRARPKVDRIACPWLIRRFVDPGEVFLYAASSDVVAVAEQFRAAAYDIDADGVFWSHRGERCTFDTMVEELGLSGLPALQRLAVIVRGADTGHPEIAPEAAGLLATALGLSRMYADDLEQLEAGMLVYDTFYRWCRDATDETHNWVSHRPMKPKLPR